MEREDLIIGYLMQSLTSEQEDEFVRLLAEDKSFAKAYERMLSIWDATSHANYTTSERFNPAEHWDAMESQMTEPTPVRRMKPHYFRTFYRVAAVVLLVLSTLFVVNTFKGDSFSPGMVYETETNARIHGLSDGSHVYLDNQSLLNIDKHFNRSSRKMRLNGKAFFVVKPDKDRVFEVVTNHLSATVKGTTFLVRTDDHSSSVGVNTGIVEVHVGNQTVTLKAGDQLDFTVDNGGVVKRSQLDVLALKQFKNGTLDYYDTPLKVIVADLKESTGVDIVVPESIENERFTMELGGASVEEIIRTIELTTNLKATKDGQTYRLI